MEFYFELRTRCCWFCADLDVQEEFLVERVMSYQQSCTRKEDCIRDMVDGSAGWEKTSLCRRSWLRGLLNRSRQTVDQLLRVEEPIIT
jgi:hypothetical protein